MDKKNIEAIFAKFSHTDPNPKTELKYLNEYTLLVSVVLSAQATDVSVNKATEPLFAFVQTPLQMIDLGEDKLKDYIRAIGLYNAKAKNVIKLSKMLIDEYNSIVPNSYDELIKLPGVGSKTARVLLNCAHNHPTIAVDTHVFRVSNRTGLTKTKTATQTELELERIIPEEYRLNAHHWLILHGRYICKARKPLCEICKISNYCAYYKNL